MRQLLLRRLLERRCTARRSGRTTPTTCLVTPPLPAVSMPCSTAARCGSAAGGGSAHSRSCSDASAIGQRRCAGFARLLPRRAASRPGRRVVAGEVDRARAAPRRADPRTDGRRMSRTCGSGSASGAGRVAWAVTRLAARAHRAGWTHVTAICGCGHPHVASIGVRSGGEDVDLDPAGDGWWTGPRPRARHRLRLPARRQRRAGARPGLALAARRRARPEPGLRPGRLRSGTTRDWAGRDLTAARRLRAARRHVHRRAPPSTRRSSASTTSSSWASPTSSCCRSTPSTASGTGATTASAGTRCTSRYGGPDGLKRFVDAAHARGLAVVLDVVYNHLGPVGQLPAAVRPVPEDRPQHLGRPGQRRGARPCAASSSTTR